MEGQCLGFTAHNDQCWDSGTLEGEAGSDRGVLDMFLGGGWICTLKNGAIFSIKFDC